MKNKKGLLKSLKGSLWLLHIYWVTSKRRVGDKKKCHKSFSFSHQETFKSQCQKNVIGGNIFTMTFKWYADCSCSISFRYSSKSDDLRALWLLWLDTSNRITDEKTLPMFDSWKSGNQFRHDPLYLCDAISELKKQKNIWERKALWTDKKMSFLENAIAISFFVGMRQNFINFLRDLAVST